MYYWARDARGSSAEIDYLINSGGRSSAIEVKSGKGGSLSSMRMLLETCPDCNDGLALYSGESAALPQQKLRFIPLYYAGSPAQGSFD